MVTIQGTNKKQTLFFKQGFSTVVNGISEQQNLLAKTTQW